MSALRIVLAQLNYQTGNFEANTNKIIRAIESATEQRADLIVFSELAVCGYPARDFLTYPHFIRQCEDSVQQILPYSCGIDVLLGTPVRNPQPEGKDLFNAALHLQNGAVKQIIHKTLLPTYDVFDEYRYFEPGKNFSCIEVKGIKLAVTICEDIWNVGNENPLYTVCPMDELIKQQPTIAINLSASPFSYVQQHERLKILQANVERYHIPFVYVNQVGAQTELIFDGNSMVMNAQGKLQHQSPAFEESLAIHHMETTDGYEIAEEQPAALIHHALVLGLRDYFAKTGITNCILGLSGGIDSAVVLCLAAEALGKEHVHSLIMPSRYSSEHSVQDAVQLCNNTQTSYDIISIEDCYSSFLSTLEKPFAGRPFSTAEENLQARTRGTLLMAYSNKFGYLLLNTTNKSEAAVGYGTLYGDMCGGLSVLGDVYKTQVYELARYINRHRALIPENILTKAPSAELRPNQKDSDSLPDYPTLDAILHRYIEQCQSPEEIAAAGFEGHTVNRVLKMVNQSEWKRQQAPPILRVSPKAFGMGRRMPIEGRYLS